MTNEIRGSDGAEHIVMVSQTNGEPITSCEHCGSKMHLPLPMPLSDFVQALEDYILGHKDCKK